MSRLLSLSIVCKLHGAIEQAQGSVISDGELVVPRSCAKGTMSGLNFFLESSVVASTTQRMYCLARPCLSVWRGRRRGAGGWSRLHEAAHENSHRRTA